MRARRPLMGFTERLYDEWLKSGLTQRQLGEYSGVNRKAISGYVNGASVPDATTLGKMCKALNVSADFLLFGKDKTITKMLEEVSNDICNNYCKWPEQWDAEKEGQELCESEICASCPLNRL